MAWGLKFLSEGALETLAGPSVVSRAPDLDLCPGRSQFPYLQGELELDLLVESKLY